MNRKEPAINDIDDAVQQFYAEKIESVPVPPPPSGTVFPDNGGREDGETSPYRKGGIFRSTVPKVAAAVLLIAFGAFLFIRPVKSSPLAETFTYLTEERQLEEKIVSGLQRAGHFLADTLEK